ncbi:hypothetical protein EDEG_03469 [Edhazardia aedis USNM 41457]|uniref:Uncharacterized protein n=1 Tax=Edhazardia aedis (strain USNM 41457) TaxID=1003232 RepID=J9D3G7_EDHAE|nr:hypothetical protein EDEG_03469 [Edhazardia aedis USNM 41457]|eukprot:EJW02084.1 hypothetical protein EDEG_03469 [Edhazardia aedis USNM 41457]
MLFIFPYILFIFGSEIPRILSRLKAIEEDILHYEYEININSRAKDEIKARLDASTDLSALKMQTDREICELEAEKSRLRSGNLANYFNRHGITIERAIDEIDNEIKKKSTRLHEQIKLYEDANSQIICCKRNIERCKRIISNLNSEKEHLQGFF